ncbi:Arylsulfatase A [Polaribacter sp. KT25b]|uniref:sulfatase n=1 Tax=Polaribacter sp. KT25b TaxID=1855336 RepID=UPI00087C1F8B|nr:sulfatase [Polaribacter sp. KT25b]SDR70200.1 Arylsulfatase A [Polaribacter sp. KT25b]
MKLNIKSIIFLLSILCTLTITSQNNTDKPNVLFIMVDDLNDWVGAFGGNKQAITPNIDALAANSTIFKNAYCAAPLCNPSRTSILTGYRPSTTGVYGNSEVFREEKGFENTITLPQYFEKNGYKTAAAGKIFHSPMGKASAPKEGSDPGSFQQEKEGGLGGTFPDKKNKLKHGLDLKKYGVKGSFLRSFDWFPVDVTLENNNDYKSADYGVNFLQESHDKPFFLACGIFRPHLPWYAPKQFFDMYKLEDIELPKTIKYDLDDVGKMGNNMAKKSVHQSIVDHGKWKEAVRAYLANVSFADACVGHLLNGLKNSKYANNTIIVLMGDHGWHLGEKEHWSKNVLWERSAKTPLLIFDPRDGNGKVSSSIVSLLDVYPTLVEMANLPQKNDLEGKSISSIVKKPSKEIHEFVLTSKDKGIHSLRSKNYRYTIYSNGFEELYDHRNDPNEWANIASNSSNKEIIEKFRKELKNTLK